MNENQLGKRILDFAFEIHTELGPGLLETVYEAHLAFVISFAQDPSRRLLFRCVLRVPCARFLLSSSARGGTQNLEPIAVVRLDL
jgi:hypothetical protein